MGGADRVVSSLCGDLGLVGHGFDDAVDGGLLVLRGAFNIRAVYGSEDMLDEYFRMDLTR